MVDRGSYTRLLLKCREREKREEMKRERERKSRGRSSYKG